MKKLLTLLFLFVLFATQAQQAVHEVSLKMNIEICSDEPNAEDDKIFTLLENPVSSQINVQATVSIYAMQLWDLNGKLLASKTIETNSASVDCSNLLPGIYIAVFSTEDKRESFKIIID